MTETPQHEPVPAFAVSPDDNSSDRAASDANFAVTASALEQLAKSSDALSNRAAELSASTQAEIVAARGQRHRFMWFMGIMAAVVAIILAGVYMQVRSDSRVLQGSENARNLIIDCVTPTGKCFREGQARTGAAIQSINQVSILAAACAPDYVTLPLAQRTDAIKACIVRGLK
jgi:hypothetical protein